MDVSETIAPNSQQVNAEDLIGGERTVTITGVEDGTKDQPVFIHLAEFPGRTFRPGKTVRRVFVRAWGKDSSAYIGRRLTIYNDPTVLWAGKPVGGIRISKMSHLTETLTIALSVSRGKREPVTIEPLPDTSGRDWLAELELAGDDPDAVKALGVAAKAAGAPETAVIRAKYTALTTPVVVPDTKETDE